jgi:outer membrane lipoprotein-sorting protein
VSTSAARALTFFAALTLVVSTAHAQNAAAPATTSGTKPPMADDIFKNVQLLKGITVAEFMDTMGFFSAAVGSNCVHCHVDESLTHWEKFAEDVPRKRRARQMIQMVNAINKANFGGAQIVTCYSCHHGDLRPESVPSLLAQYSLPVEDPNRVEPVPDTKGPSAEQILDKFIEAVGGVQNLANATSFSAQGTYQGFDTYEQKVPVELFVKSPNQRTTIIHTQNGDTTAVFDGRQGWLASVERPVTLLPLDRSDLDGASLDARIWIPREIKHALTRWRAGFPMTSIDDRAVHVVEGTGEHRTRFKLFFAADSGLLVRLVRYASTAVGVVPTQTDYSDYRALGRIKIPFKTIVTSTNGQGTIELSDVQPNVSIDPSRFTKPSPAVVKPAVR